MNQTRWLATISKVIIICGKMVHTTAAWAGVGKTVRYKQEQP